MCKRPNVVTVVVIKSWRLKLCMRSRDSIFADVVSLCRHTKLNMLAQDINIMNIIINSKLVLNSSLRSKLQAGNLPSILFEGGGH